MHQNFWLKFTLVVTVFSLNLSADITFYTWNLKHLGRPKQDLELVAKILLGEPKLSTNEPYRPGQMIVLQEVNTTESGTLKLKQLRDLFKKAGKIFCIGFSDPKPKKGQKPDTEADERYAMMWEENAIAYVTTQGKVLDSCPDYDITLPLIKKHADKIKREPAYGKFIEKDSKKEFFAASVHLVPTSKGPSREVPYVFDALNEIAGALPMVLGGDFNLSAANNSFEAARAMGFRAVFAAGTKTSLKRNRRQMSKAYDNIFIKELAYNENEDENLGGPSVRVPFQIFTNPPSYLYDNVSDHSALRVLLDFKAVPKRFP